MTEIHSSDSGGFISGVTPVIRLTYHVRPPPLHFRNIDSFHQCLASHFERTEIADYRYDAPSSAEHPQMVGEGLYPVVCRDILANHSKLSEFLPTKARVTYISTISCRAPGPPVQA